MSAFDALQLSGAAGIAVFAALLAQLFVSEGRRTAYGKPAFACVIAWAVVSATFTALAAFDLLPAKDVLLLRSTPSYIVTLILAEYSFTWKEPTSHAA